jgi:hypothetical protein
MPKDKKRQEEFYAAEALAETPETPAEHEQRVADMVPMPETEPGIRVFDFSPERIVEEDDGEFPPQPFLPLVADSTDILDQVAIELFVKGWPHDDIYNRAAMFLRIRAAHMAGEPYVVMHPQPVIRKVQKR